MRTRAELESTFSQMWSEKLDVHPVCPDDNFFALGGDSLLAADLLMEIYERLGIEVDASVLFLKPTITELVDEILAAA